MCNHTQLDHIIYCPVLQQKHQICYHHRCPCFHHRVVLRFACATIKERGTCKVRAFALVSDRAHLIETPVVISLFFANVHYIAQT